MGAGMTARKRACVCGRVDCQRHARKAWKGGHKYQRAYDAVHQELRRQLLARAMAAPQAARCHLCGLPAREGDPWEADHIIPASRGGASTKDNVALAHRTCNRRRGSQLGAQTSAERRRKGGT